MTVCKVSDMSLVQNIKNVSSKSNMYKKNIKQFKITL